MRFVLDSNAYDFVVEDPEVHLLAVRLVEAEKIELLMTHVQEDELAAIPDAKKREAIASLPRTLVATYGIVVGEWRLGRARLGDAEKIEAIRNHSGKHTRDALIAATAQYEDAALVTNERRLTNFARRAGIEVWSPDRFIAFLGELATGERADKER
jgi:predicted nucleic acid-binding protein